MTGSWSPEKLQGRCCVAGGGPAGMMLGYLLARAGIEVLVLEKHADFLRDFRGDTVHPSTLEVMHELGLLDEFLKRPHQKQVRQIRAQIGRDEIEKRPRFTPDGGLRTRVFRDSEAIQEICERQGWHF